MTLRRVFGILPFFVPLVHAEITVSTNFEGASAKVLSIDQARHEIRITPAGDPRRGWPNWWYFQVEGVDPARPLIVEIVTSEAAVPNDAGELRKLNPSWTLPASAAVSTDGETWGQSPPGDRAGNSGRYTIASGSSRLWLAWGPPYMAADVRRLIDDVTKAPDRVKVFTLAESRENRPVYGLQIAEGNRAAAERPAVWITGRQHAWECGGSWVAVGYLEWLLGNDEDAQWLRQNAEVFVVPIMDVDHVATGDGGKGAVPQDHNRDWSASPHWPEVAALQRRIIGLAGENRLAVYLDSHNPGAGAQVQTFYVQYPPYCGKEAAEAQDSFLSAARVRFGELRILDGKPSIPEHLPIWKAIAASWVVEHGNPSTVSLTVETPWNNAAGTPTGYKEVGAKLGRSTAAYLKNEFPIH